MARHPFTIQPIDPVKWFADSAGVWHKAFHSAATAQYLILWAGHDYKWGLPESYVLPLWFADEYEPLTAPPPEAERCPICEANIAEAHGQRQLLSVPRATTFKEVARYDIVSDVAL